MNTRNFSYLSIIIVFLEEYTRLLFTNGTCFLNNKMSSLKLVTCIDSTPVVRGSAVERTGRGSWRWSPSSCHTRPPRCYCRTPTAFRRSRPTIGDNRPPRRSSHRCRKTGADGDGTGRRNRSWCPLRLRRRRPAGRPLTTGRNRCTWCPRTMPTRRPRKTTKTMPHFRPGVRRPRTPPTVVPGRRRLVSSRPAPATATGRERRTARRRPTPRSPSYCTLVSLQMQRYIKLLGVQIYKKKKNCALGVCMDWDGFVGGGFELENCREDIKKSYLLYVWL